MSNQTSAMSAAPRPVSAEKVAVPILAAISVSHLLNDLIQSLLPAIYPILKANYHLDFGQIGLLTLTFQCTASLLQPMIGTFTDKRPQPFSLVAGMGITLIGLLTLSQAGSYPVLLLAAALIGMGSSIFHPESSRVARLASGGQHGLAQSVFQVGGNAGSALGPLLAAFIVVPFGQPSIAWFSAVALLAMLILSIVGRWYQAKLADLRAKPRAVETGSLFTKRRVVVSIAILMLLIFSKDFYVASFTNYFTFYLISKFGLAVQDAQIHLFIFLGALAVGTLLGGPIGDRVGRRYVIWLSILGVLPFTLLLPFADLFWTTVLSVIIGVVLASAFSSIVVYAIELVPGRVGMIAGFFFGFSFGMAGIGAAALGHLADATSIATVYTVCSFLPALGLLAYFLPKIEKPKV